MLPKSDENTEFVLKHRIVGAAFLLFFGALFLPWLLGAPTEASKLPNSTNTTTNSDLSSDDIENELLKAIEDEQITEVEKVYISKITPLDADKLKDEVKPAAKEEAVSPPVKQTIAKPEPVIETKLEKEQKPLVKEPAEKSDNAPDVAVQKETQVTAKANKVEVGWIVQVGMFTDKNGAARVVTDLKQKGFDPSTTVVDTNRGKGTGTRVWLGPYAQRVDAAKAKTRLSGKTGVAGFIRAYP